MIKWCAFCQRFQGEVAPFARKEVSHGLCARCSKLGLNWTVEQERRIEYLGGLSIQFWTAGMTRNVGELRKLIDEAVQNGIRPIDLLFGLAGPAMAKVGDLWARNLLTVQEEHQFTETCEVFIEMIAERIQLKNQLIQPTGSESTPRILLANVPGNEHTLGLRFTQLGLVSMGLNCEIMDSEASNQEILNRAKKMRATVVGFSVSMVEQLPSLLSALEVFVQSGLLVRIILGGGVAVTEGLIETESLPKNVSLVSLLFDESERNLFTGDLNSMVA